MRLKKFVLLAAAAALVLGLGLGANAAQRMAKVQTLRYNVGAEPETLDPALSTGIPEAVIEYNVFEGLTRLDSRNNAAPGIAKSWKVSADGKTYTFKLRDAKWSDGSAVTAKDFEYAWKRVLDPKVAAEYSYQLFYLKNAESFYTGKISDASKIGVKATDDKTLVVELEAPTPYFLSLCAVPTLAPVKKAAVDANPKAWFTKPATYVGNGPFKMTKWDHNNVVELVKNDKYWDASAVKLDKLVITLIDNPNTELTMFETDQLDFGDNPPNSEMIRLKKESKVKIAPYIGTYYYMFNVKKAPFDNEKVRKALTYAIDKQKLIDFVVKGGQEPALAYVPGGMVDVKKSDDFREKGGNFYKDADLAAAKKLLTEAGYPDGKGFPTVTILYNTSENHKKIAEAIQEMWKKSLNVNVQIRNEEWNVYMDSRDKGDFQVCRAGWIGDYPDAMTFMDMWTTGNGNNDTGWSNKTYDKLIDTAKSTGNAAVRIKAMHDAEKILMAEMPIAPIYFYTLPYLEKPWVKGVMRSSLGMIDFKKAWILHH